MKRRLLFVLGIILIGGGSYLLMPSFYEKEMRKVIDLKNHSSEQSFDGVVEPQVPLKDANDKTLLGVDTNGNDLRDDVEIWINRTAKDYNERMAMRQYAISLTYQMIASIKNKYNVVSHAKSVTYTDSSCMSFIFGRDSAIEVEDRIWKMVSNNKMRNAAFEYLNTKVYSYQSVIENMGVNQSYLACSFKIENENNLMEKYLNHN